MLRRHVVFFWALNPDTLRRHVAFSWARNQNLKDEGVISAIYILFETQPESVTFCRILGSPPQGLPFRVLGAAALDPDALRRQMVFPPAGALNPDALCRQMVFYPRGGPKP